MPAPTNPPQDSQFQRMEKIVWGSLDPTVPQEDAGDEDDEDEDE